jgi:hypothetical protein
VIEQIIVLAKKLNLMMTTRHVIASFHIWSEVILNKKKKLFF